MADGTVYIDTDVDGSGFDIELSNLRNEIKRTEVQLDKLIEKQIRFVETGGNRNTRAFQGMEYDIENTKAKLESLRIAETQLTQNTTMSKNAFEAFKRALKNFIPNVVKASGELLKLSGRTILNGIKKLGVSLKNIGKHSKSSRVSLLKMLGTSLLMGMAFRALMSVMNGVKQGMNNLAQYSDETNQDLSLLKSSLTQLKNSFATAFAPILSVVTPILNSLINSLSKAMTYIGMFMASLTGKGTFVKALEVQEDYAAGLDSSADSAKNAEKANKGYLSGLDEVSKYSSDSSASSSKGSVSPAAMFKEVTLDNPMSNLADIFKQKIESGDWSEIGALLAQKVNQAFSGLDFSQIASSLGTKIKNAFDFAIGFIENVNWQELGSNLWNALLDIVTNIDWSGLVSRAFRFLGAAVGGAAGLIIGFCVELWNSLKQGFEDIKARYFEPYMNEMGEFTIEGLFNGILDMICDIGTWIKDHIFTPFIDGFKNAFGIHSPSTVMEEMGGYIIEGLLNGVKTLVEDVIGVFTGIKDSILETWDKIKEKTGETWDKVKTSLGDAWDGLKSKAGTFGENVKSTISSSWNKLKSNTSEAWDKVKTNLGSTWENLKSKASTFGNNVKETFSSSWSTLKTNTGQTWDNIKTKVSDVCGKILTNTKDAWKDTEKSTSSALSDMATDSYNQWSGIGSNSSQWAAWIFNSVSGSFNSLKARVSDLISNLYGALHNIWGSIGDNSSQWAEWIYKTLYNKFMNIKNNIIWIFNSMGSGISNSINSIIYVLNRMISGVVGGINSMISALNGLSFSIPKWVPGIGGNSFGLNIGYVYTPQIPYLATGAVIPPNAPFMAMLGDQKNGRNLEMPENLLRQIVREESGNANRGGNATYRFTGQINRRVLFDEFIEEAKLRQIQTGRNPLEFA